MPRPEYRSLHQQLEVLQTPGAPEPVELTRECHEPYSYTLMSAGLPDIVDAWRMLSARRSFEGSVPLLSMPRLCEALEEPEGDCRFALQFDKGVLDVPYVEVRVQAELPLVCQRSLRRFLLPVDVVQRLALVESEGQEDALPEDYEALVLDADGTIRPLDLIEDELILAVPVVPVDPASEPVEMSWPPSPHGEAGTDAVATPVNPFAVLASIRKK